jgi:hypothetical protein
MTVASEVEKARSDLWAALCDVLPSALNPDAISTLRDALDALIVARLADNQKGE